MQIFEEITMIPSNIPLKGIDKGIRNLVININRIPEVYTLTNCEGHIWRDTPLWPTKDGWMYFLLKNNTHPQLIPDIRKFMGTHPSFSLKEQGNCMNPGFQFYTVNAVFESHDNGTLFERITKAEQEAYFSRAEVRLKENLQGWADLNRVVIDYLRSQYGQGYRSLPYKDPAPRRRHSRALRMS